MRKLASLLVLFAAGCMTAADNDCKEAVVRTVHDTVTVAKTDTIIRREVSKVFEVDTVVKMDTVKIVRRDTLFKRDTIRVVQKDTVIRRDTVKVTIRDTIRKTDTLVVRDTVKMLANVTDPNDLVGVWDGASGAQKVTLAFTEGLAYLEFSGNLNGAAVTGYIKSIDNGQAKVVHAGFKDATWLLSLEGGVLTVEEIGTKMFASATTTLKKR